jgi:alpha-tubulin suppressor-like RCC1 family protein
MPNEVSFFMKDEGQPFFQAGEEAPQIQQISAGGHHSLVLTTRGMLYSFGYGAHGQLGLRGTTNQLAP